MVSGTGSNAQHEGHHNARPSKGQPNIELAGPLAEHHTSWLHGAAYKCQAWKRPSAGQALQAANGSKAQGITTWQELQLLRHRNARPRKGQTEKANQAPQWRLGAMVSELAAMHSIKGITMPGRAKASNLKQAGITAEQHTCWHNGPVAYKHTPGPKRGPWQHWPAEHAAVVQGSNP